MDADGAGSSPSRSRIQAAWRASTDTIAATEASDGLVRLPACPSSAATPRSSSVRAVAANRSELVTASPKSKTGAGFAREPERVAQEGDVCALVGADDAGVLGELAREPGVLERLCVQGGLQLLHLEREVQDLDVAEPRPGSERGCADPADEDPARKQARAGQHRAPAGGVVRRRFRFLCQLNSPHRPVQANGQNTQTLR